MFQSFGNLFGNKAPQKSGPIFAEQSAAPQSAMRGSANRTGAAYTKVFRWRLPDGQTDEPKTVEIVGSFTHWQRVPLMRDSVLDAWHATVHHIPGNKTHHYMLLVDGKPTADKHCDGLAIPHGPHEESFAIQTDRGPRVFMMFGQTK